MPSRVEFNAAGEASNAFEQLVGDLRKVLGPSSGIDSEDVDPARLQSLMELYDTDEKHWAPYALGDASRAYTRNLVDEGNGKCNLLILVWSPGKGSPVHDHANAHCVMKVLRGSLCETLYEWPEEPNAPLQIKKETTFKENQVTYMSDQLGLHKVSNPDPTVPAISLHLYTPPNAAKYGCHMFDEKTGNANHVKQCHFFSILGQKTAA